MHRRPESVLGPEVTIFKATSSDNMKGIVSYQMVDDAVYEHGAWAGSRTRPRRYLDPGDTWLRGGGEPLTVTPSHGNVIKELRGAGGRPTPSDWRSPPIRHQGDTIPIGALAERLPDHLAAEYGNDYILRRDTKQDDDGPCTTRPTVQSAPRWG